MSIDQPNLRVIDHDQMNRYELRVDGRLAAVAIYRREDDRIAFTYTELMRGFEGRRLGDVLAACALEDVRRRGAQLGDVSCPFIGAFIEDHPEYAAALH